MRISNRLLALLFSASVAVAGVGALSAESLCLECRKAALLKVQLCNAKAKSEAEKKECTKLAQELTKACTEGVCKASMGK